jgi:hypothetical protein
MKASSTTFNKGAGSFVPKGKMRVTEDLFPTLGGEAEEPKKKKAQVVKPVAI